MSYELNLIEQKVSVDMSESKAGAQQAALASMFIQRQFTLNQPLQSLHLDCSRESLQRTLSLLTVDGIRVDEVFSNCGQKDWRRT